MEYHRATSDAFRRLARAFADWGIPTAESLLMAQRGAPGLPLIASGGMRTGIEAAKALALGASLVGVASSFLKAAASGPEEVVATIDQLAAELRVAMFCAGAGNIGALREPERLMKVE